MYCGGDANFGFRLYCFVDLLKKIENNFVFKIVLPSRITFKNW